MREGEVDSEMAVTRPKQLDAMSSSARSFAKKNGGFIFGNVQNTGEVYERMGSYHCFERVFSLESSVVCFVSK